MQRGMFESQKGPSGREDRGGVELSGDSMEEADEFVRNGVVLSSLVIPWKRRMSL